MELNSKYAAIDSCIILRVIQRNVPEQARLATNLLLNGQDFYVDPVAIMEVVHVFTREHKARAEIVEDLTIFLSNPMIIYDKEFFDPIIKKYSEHPSLSFDDCVLESRVEAKGYLPLWTFDKKFARQSETARLLTY